MDNYTLSFLPLFTHTLILTIFFYVYIVISEMWGDEMASTKPPKLQIRTRDQGISLKTAPRPKSFSYVWH